MEIYRQRGPDKVFKWKDITFHLRPRGLSGDKHDLIEMGEIDKNGKAFIPMNKFYRRAIELFVKSWEGVTEDGKPVPFSMENLNSLPVENGDGDVIRELGAFIYNNCAQDLPEEKKKA